MIFSFFCFCFFLLTAFITEFASFFQPRKKETTTSKSHTDTCDLLLLRCVLLLFTFYSILRGPAAAVVVPPCMFRIDVSIHVLVLQRTCPLLCCWFVLRFLLLLFLLLPLLLLLLLFSYNLLSHSYLFFSSLLFSCVQHTAH